MKKIRIKRDDYWRVLLTEVLPYETPLNFSNYGFFLIAKKNSISNAPEYIQDLFKLHKGNLIPLRYKVAKSTYDYRTLTLVHPIAQLDYVDLYKKYNTLIIYLCNRSKQSLRKPTKVTSSYFWPEDWDLEEDPDANKIAISNFFTYQKYSRLHRFYESKEFLDLEKRFNRLVSIDISKCFSSIYSHTISWAIKGIEHAKANRRSTSFESDFDKLIQRSNYSETNGIPIGPEASRIFAEIILQDIDLRIQQSIGYDKQYEIRRYIDDYFIFTNNEADENEILRIIREELEHFKLYINESKTESMERPFITRKSLSISRIKDYLKTVEDSLFFDGKKKEHIKKLLQLSRRNALIKDVKFIIRDNRDTFETISTYLIKVIKSYIRRLISFSRFLKANDDYQDAVEKALLALIDLVFFIFRMDIKVNNTYLISEIAIDLRRGTDKWRHETKFRIFDKVYRCTLEVLQDSRSHVFDGVEALNLIIALREYPKTYKLEEATLIECFSSEGKLVLNYFRCAVLLYYIRNESRYSNLKKAIITHIEESLGVDKYGPRSTENFLMFFDFLSSSYVPIATKRKVVQAISSFIEHKNMSQQDIEDVIDFIKERTWFTDWNAADKLDFLFLKKNVTQPY